MRAAAPSDQRAAWMEPIRRVDGAGWIAAGGGHTLGRTYDPRGAGFVPLPARHLGRPGTAARGAEGRVAGPQRPHAGAHGPRYPALGRLGTLPPNLGPHARRGHAL